jgi:hypothetical protein
MLAPNHQLRACSSALLLLVQALGLGHLALAEHALGPRGALADVVAQVAHEALQTHAETDPHSCALQAAMEAEAPHACMVAAVWAAPSVAAQPVALVLPRAVVLGAGYGWVATPQFDALSSAPKTSPPG